MSEDTMRLAVLIDADNTSPKQTREIFEELAGYGTLTVKRAYGDWTTSQLNGWKDQLHAHAISPMQQFANTAGKNSTDSALIIDAMDLLYAGNLDGFVIVSSDADFTRLATRLRESGMTVYGLGQRKTPKPFVEACDKFIYLEVLGSSGSQDASADGPHEPDGALQSLMTKAANKAAQDDEGWTRLDALGSVLTRTDPSFDPRTYGAGRLGDLVKELGYLETRSQADSGGRAQLWVRLKGTQRATAKKSTKATAQKAAQKSTQKKTAQKASRSG